MNHRSAMGWYLLSCIIPSDSVNRSLFAIYVFTASALEYVKIECATWRGYNVVVAFLVVYEWRKVLGFAKSEKQEFMCGGSRGFNPRQLHLFVFFQLIVLLPEYTFENWLCSPVGFCANELTKRPKAYHRQQVYYYYVVVVCCRSSPPILSIELLINLLHFLFTYVRESRISFHRLVGLSMHDRLSYALRPASKDDHF